MHASRRRQHVVAVLTEPVTVVARPPSSNSFAMNQAVGLRGMGGLALVRPQIRHHSLAPLLHALAAMHPLHHCQSSHPRADQAHTHKTLGVTGLMISTLTSTKHVLSSATRRATRRGAESRMASMVNSRPNGMWDRRTPAG